MIERIEKWTRSKAVQEDKKKDKDTEDSLLASLKHIIKNSNPTEAPAEIEFCSKHYEYSIGIGNDHTASIVLDKDALKALNKIVPD